VLAGPACGTSSWSLTVAAARSRRGAGFEATDRDLRGQPIRPLGLSPSSSRATPKESREVVSRDTPTQSPHDAKRKAGNGAGGRWSERQMDIVEARVERLEAALEGLQDAIRRQAVLRDEQIDELDRPTHASPDRSRPQPRRPEGAESDGLFTADREAARPRPL
jgi:hypothetical protein